MVKSDFFELHVLSRFPREGPTKSASFGPLNELLDVEPVNYKLSGFPVDVGGVGFEARVCFISFHWQLVLRLQKLLMVYMVLFLVWICSGSNPLQALESSFAN